MILMLQGNDQISVCNRPGLHSIPHHCSPLLNTTPLLSSDCSSADDDHREGQDDNDPKIFYSQSPQSGVTLLSLSFVILLTMIMIIYAFFTIEYFPLLGSSLYMFPPAQTISCYIIITYIKILLCVKDLLPLLWIFWSVQLLWVQSTAALQNGLVLQWGVNLIFPCLTQYLVRAANP